MKRIIVLIGILTIISCGKKEKTIEVEKTTDKMEGIFSGSFNKDKVRLEINKEQFDITINDNKISGKIVEMEDGSVIKLVPEEGKSLKYNQFKFSDSYTLQMINYSGDSIIASDDYFLDKEGVE